MVCARKHDKYLFAERLPHKPIITELRNPTVLLGESVELECRVISDLTPFIQWYKSEKNNGSLVNETSGWPYGYKLPVSFYLFSINFAFLIYFQKFQTKGRSLGAL